MADESISTTQTNRLEMGGKLLIAVAALAYGVGLVIVNVHLARYGVFTAGLGRAEYAMAGFACLFFAASSYGATHFVRARLLNNLDSLPWMRRLLRYIRYTLSNAVLATLPLMLLSIGQLHLLRVEVWLLLTVLLVAFLGVDQIIRFVQGDWRTMIPLREPYKEADAARASFYVLTESFAAVLIFLVGYALLAYPDILPAFGGGAVKANVLLLSAPTSSETCRALGLPVSKDNKRVGPVYILLETTDQLCLLSKRTPIWERGDATWVNKSMFIGRQTIDIQSSTR